MLLISFSGLDNGQLIISRTCSVGKFILFNETRLTKYRGVQGFTVLLFSLEIADHPHCSYLMYVGMTERPLRERFREYFSEKRDATKSRPKLLKLLNVYEDYLHFCCSVIEETERIEEVEKALLNTFIPPCNDEYPAEISRIMKAFP